MEMNPLGNLNCLNELCANCGQTLGKHAGGTEYLGACPNPNNLGNARAPKFLCGQYFNPSGRYNE